MRNALIAVYPLGEYRLQLIFQNGSTAMINMTNRVQTLRFSRLGSPEVFGSVKAAGDRVFWSDGAESISIYVNELLDFMMLD